MDNAHSDSPREDRLADALEKYLGVGDPHAPDARSDFLEHYPDLADDLSACLETLDFIDRAVGGGPAAAVLECGQQFGDYYIRREIGRGGMGVVYEAFHLGLERRVALKVLSGRGLEDESRRERFLREAKTAAGLHHTNIVPIFEVGELAGVCYYAMQFIPGESLGRILRRLRSVARVSAGADTTVFPAGTVVRDQRVATEGAEPPPADSGESPTRTLVTKGNAVWQALSGGPVSETYFREAARLAAQAADALAYASRHGVVHRDIKPSNLIVDAEGTLWTTDFGLARRAADTADGTAKEPAGTPAYMSPEQAAGSATIDHRTDIYSLGATLYELLTLRPMFTGETALAVMAQIATVTPPSPRALCRLVPRDLDAIVCKATAQRPEDRYGDAASLAADLRRYLSHEPVSVRPPGLVGRLVRWCRREPRLAALAAAAAALLIAVSGWFHWAVLKERDAAVAERKVAVAEADRATRAEAQSQENLWDALYQQARATRLSFEKGRRLTAIDLIRRAREIRPDAVLRDEAIAALSVTDARLAKRLRTGSDIELLAFAPHGKRIACYCRDGSIKLWKLDGGDEPVVLAEPAPNVTAWSFRVWAFSDCGRFLAATLRDGTIGVWDVESERLVESLAVEDDFRVLFLAFVGREPRLIAVAPDGECRRWAFDEQRATSLPPFELSPWRRAVRGPDATSITLVLASGAVEVWDLATGERRPVPRIALGSDRLAAMAWNASGDLLAVAQHAGSVDLWSPGQAQPRGSLGGHRGPVFALAFDPTGTMLVSGAAFDPALRLWSVPTRELIASLREPQSRPRAVCFSSDGRMVAAGGSDQTICLWEIVTPQSVRVMAAHEDVVGRAAFAPDGRSLASGAEDGSVLLWRTDSHEPPTEIVPASLDADANLKPSACAGLAFSSDGRRLATRTRAGTIEVHDLASRQLVARLDARQRSWVWDGSMVFLADGSALVRTSGREIQRWTIGEREPVTVATASEPIFAVATARDGSRVAVSTWRDRRVEVFELPSGSRSLKPLELSATAAALAFSPDGQVLAVGDRDGMVHLYRLADGRPARSWREADDAISAVTFSPDGRQLVVASLDGTVRLRDPSTGDVIARLPGHAGGTRSAAFSSDGTRLATCGDDKQVRVWHLPTLHGELSELGLAWHAAP